MTVTKLHLHGYNPSAWRIIPSHIWIWFSFFRCFSCNNTRKYQTERKWENIEHCHLNLCLSVHPLLLPCTLTFWSHWIVDSRERKDEFHNRVLDSEESQLFNSTDTCGIILSEVDRSSVSIYYKHFSNRSHRLNSGRVSMVVIDRIFLARLFDGPTARIVGKAVARLMT